MHECDNVPSVSVRTFWREIAPREHIAQFYESEGALIDSLAGFVGEGLLAGENAVVIATAEHREALEQRLRSSGADVVTAREQGRYIALVAQDALARFMVKEWPQGKHWPDDDRFNEFITGLLTRAHRDGRRVRVFGEMVALLWANGDQGATVRLEYLWRQMCKAQGFSLFCAYPKAGFTEDSETSLAAIRAAHSRIL
jgi:MEDS: MEthanogen/methylotroph, DcmR Sensory domain